MPRKTPAKKTTSTTKSTKPAVAAATKKVTKTTKVTRTKKTSPRSKPVIKEAIIETPDTESFIVDSETTDKPTTKAKSFRISKVFVITFAAILLIGFGIYYYRGLFVAAVVNGQPISRLTVVQAAEKQGGKQSLDTLIRNILIEQEAKKEGVTVSDKEVDDQMKSVQTKLAQQGQNIDQVLAMQGMTKDDLRKLMRLDKLVQKMVGKNIKITDKQVNDYIEQNKASLPQNQDESKLRDTVKAQLQQQQLQQQVQTWLTNLQSKSKILYFVQY